MLFNNFKGEVTWYITTMQCAVEFSKLYMKSSKPKQIPYSEHIDSKIYDILLNATNTPGRQNQVLVSNAKDGVFTSKNDRGQLLFDLLVDANFNHILDVYTDILLAIHSGHSSYKDHDESVLRDKIRKKLEYLDFRSVILDCVSRLYGKDFSDKLYCALIDRNLDGEFDELYLRRDLVSSALFQGNLFCWFELSYAYSIVNLNRDRLFTVFEELKTQLWDLLVKTDFHTDRFMNAGSKLYGLFKQTLDYDAKSRAYDILMMYNKSDIIVQEYQAPITDQVEKTKVSTSLNLSDTLNKIVMVESILCAHNPHGYQSTFMNSILLMLQQQELYDMLPTIKGRLKHALSRRNIILNSTASFLSSTEKHPLVMKLIHAQDTSIRLYSTDFSMADFKEKRTFLQTFCEQIVLPIIEKGLQPNTFNLIEHIISSNIDKNRKFSSFLDANNSSSSYQGSENALKVYADCGHIIEGALAYRDLVLYIKSNNLNIFDIHRELTHDRVAAVRFLDIESILSLSYDTYSLDMHQNERQIFDVSNFTSLAKQVIEPPADIVAVDLDVKIKDISNSFIGIRASTGKSFLPVYSTIQEDIEFIGCTLVNNLLHPAESMLGGAITGISSNNGILRPYFYKSPEGAPGLSSLDLANHLVCGGNLMSLFFNPESMYYEYYNITISFLMNGALYYTDQSETFRFVRDTMILYVNYNTKMLQSNKFLNTESDSCYDDFITFMKTNSCDVIELDFSFFEEAYSLLWEQEEYQVDVLMYIKNIFAKLDTLRNSVNSLSEIIQDDYRSVDVMELGLCADQTIPYFFEDIVCTDFTKINEHLTKFGIIVDININGDFVDEDSTILEFKFNDNKLVATSYDIPWLDLDMIGFVKLNEGVFDNDSKGLKPFIQQTFLGQFVDVNSPTAYKQLVSNSLVYVLVARYLKYIAFRLKNIYSSENNMAIHVVPLYVILQFVQQNTILYTLLDIVNGVHVDLYAALESLLTNPFDVYNVEYADNVFGEDLCEFYVSDIDGILPLDFDIDLVEDFMVQLLGYYFPEEVRDIFILWKRDYYNAFVVGDGQLETDDIELLSVRTKIREFISENVGAYSNSNDDNYSDLLAEQLSSLIKHQPRDDMSGTILNMDTVSVDSQGFFIRKADNRHLTAVARVPNTQHKIRYYLHVSGVFGGLLRDKGNEKVVLLTSL